MPRRYKMNCETCSKSYLGRGMRFCSNSCRVTWTNLHRNVAKLPDVRAKISFARRGRATIWGEKHWNWQGKSLPRFCIDCGKRLMSDGWGKHGLVKRCHSCSHRGELSPMWKGGATPLRIKEYGTERYKNFVNIVLERDNYTCRYCGSKNGMGHNIRLEVHHLKSYAEYPELRYDPSNGITLCRPCHMTTIRGTPKPKMEILIKC